MTLNTSVTGNCRLMGVMAVSSVQVRSPFSSPLRLYKGTPSSGTDAQFSNLGTPV
jgi:hypothetical protein